MRTAAEYRHHADECRKLAAKMKTGTQRDHMLKIAKVWDHSADEANRVRQPSELEQSGEAFACVRRAVGSG